MLKGLVETFDDRRGDGTIRADDGDLLYFHCVALVDGSRSVAPGTLISARRGVGHLGHDEAFEIVKKERDV